MKLVNRLRTTVCLLLVLLHLQGCGAYSFTGVNLSPTVQTISVQNFYNDTGMGPPNISQELTESLRTYYQRNTSLGLVNEEGDLQLEGSIVGYTLSPVAPTASGNANVPDRAGLQRLTITVKVDFVNTQDETQNFSKNFSWYSDYNPDVTELTAEEPRLITEIFDTIILEIFTNTVANW